LTGKDEKKSYSQKAKDYLLTNPNLKDKHAERANKADATEILFNHLAKDEEGNLKHNLYEDTVKSLKSGNIT
jgi:hypothetical protein